MPAIEDPGRLVRPDSVHRSVYTDPSVFKLEMERIYGQAWIYVGHESEIRGAGDYRLSRIGDQDVILVRAADHQVHVLYNRCPHRGIEILGEGKGCVGRTIRCPYHGWTFRLDGTHVGTPLRDGLAGTAFDPAHPDFSMRRVARIDSHRGFVFASQADHGPDLRSFLGGVITSIDNLCDRSPEGEVEVAGGGYRVMHDSNWKFFYENVIDMMHPFVTHQSIWSAARKKSREIGNLPMELQIGEGLGAPYQTWEQLELRAYGNGHGILGNIFLGVGLDLDPVSKAHFESLAKVHGAERAAQILGLARHNTILYGSGALQTTFQLFRILRPLAVDRTLQEVQLFRLKGAPDSVFRRALLFANVAFSPASTIMPDDMELYRRGQAGNRLQGGDWISLHRHHGSDVDLNDSRLSKNGTSELLIREQYRAWQALMRGNAANAGQGLPAC